jgi:hypothetical protein
MSSNRLSPTEIRESTSGVHHGSASSKSRELLVMTPSLQSLTMLPSPSTLSLESRRRRKVEP